MARLTWDKVEDRTYQSGVNQGVLYPKSSSGVAWNGLVSVNETPSGGTATPYHIDGFKYHASSTPEDYEATIDAFTYPDEFERCDGTAYDLNGLGYDLQAREEFGFSYRTLVGGETGEIGYKIHLVYNALAEPTTSPFESLDDSSDIITFSWKVSAKPIKIPGRRPTSHFIVDSTRVHPDVLALLENILYGSSNSDPRLPLPQEVTDILNSNRYRIGTLNGAYRPIYSPDSPIFDVVGDLSRGVYTITPDTMLRETSVSGIYRLD